MIRGSSTKYGSISGARGLEGGGGLRVSQEEEGKKRGKEGKRWGKMRK